MGDSLIEFISYFLTHWATSTILYGAFQQANEEMWTKAAVPHQKYIKKRNRLNASPSSYCRLAKIFEMKPLSSKNQVY